MAVTEYPFDLEIRISNTVPDEETLRLVVSRVKKAVLETVKAICGFEPTYWSVVETVDYPDALYRLGKGRIR